MQTFLLCVVALGHLVLGQIPQVTVSQGTMKGQALKSRDGRDFFSFTKIPYAKPPVGELRFKISEKADNWTDILDATQRVPYCYQPNQGISGIVIQEDCLYLNIFTPNTTGKLPVIFSIHGGGFMTGSADYFSYGRFFMDEDVVFVAPNYRLGTLGFLSLEDNSIPGNMGLKDQALALEWVYKEISAFGGDPNMITVIGESAGGVSSNLICSAPRTNGLIKGCVSQSGNNWSPWSYQKPGVPRERALNLVKAVGCDGSKDYLKCLQSKPIEQVSDISLLSNVSTGLSIISPILEPSSAPGALLTVWPPVAKKSYPWIVGMTQDDGLLFTYEYEYKMKSQQEIDQFINNFNNTVISKLNLENKVNDFQKIWERFFTRNLEPLRAIREFFTEYMFLYPTLKGLSKQSGPTFFYKFNYFGGPQLPFVITVPNIGVGHAAEMPYFFEVLPGYKVPTGWPRQEDTALSKQLVKMWVNFARDQTPSSNGVVQWSQFQEKYYLDIEDQGITLGELTKYKEILDFWDSIIPDQSSKSSTSQASLMFIGILSIFTLCRGLLL
ncbi:juvenile hormone esterase [Halyomorpha halys]|uniref:juvenile hormone esterase n=1 Tax=Halyomorpha halys TaxID=286706 RepID=UPI0006D4E428|nr:uncharacterized protein LOC106680431 [Halyomorpha halys]